MAALTAARDTLELASPFAFAHERGVAAGETIYRGSLIVLNASGYLESATAAGSKLAVGRASETVDNSAGGDGDLTCKFRSGVYRWANKGGDLVAVGDIGAACYIEDDQTVRITSAGTSAAGYVYDVTTAGVDVLTAFPIPAV